MMKLHHTFLFTGRPTSLAAVAFDPIAYSDRPYGVWVKKYHAIAATIRVMKKATGMPARRVEPNLISAGSIPLTKV